jgi:hypothetical protein
MAMARPPLTFDEWLPLRLTSVSPSLIASYRELERDFATLTARRMHAIVPAVIRSAQSQPKMSVRAKLD